MESKNNVLQVESVGVKLQKNENSKQTYTSKLKNKKFNKNNKDGSSSTLINNLHNNNVKCKNKKHNKEQIDITPYQDQKKKTNQLLNMSHIDIKKKMQQNEQKNEQKNEQMNEQKNEQKNERKKKYPNNNKNKENKIIKIKSDDNYLNQLVKKEDTYTQCVEQKSVQNNNMNTHHNNNNVPNILYNNQEYHTNTNQIRDTADHDIYNTHIIEHYKKITKQELEEKKKKKIQEIKAKLIKKTTTKNAYTQVVLDDFTKFYESIKPAIDKIVEDVSYKALKKIYEERELEKIKKNIDFYENIRNENYKSLQVCQENSEAFVKETKKRIKDRAQLKKNVETIMMKNMAHTEAQKYVHYIFQKNLDIYSDDNYMPNNVQKNMNLIIVPYIIELIIYLMNVRKEIVHHTMGDMIEQALSPQSDIYEKLKE
ncbi:conserved Plasmodium protein, unknown function [Plasmodium reichenowi]|uniref:Uncharacterized protein n=2 Tax=Plasmodium reichenowi TaxID=5854 RepID=A0A2P9DN96_PLARE|nr:conserved Plasmodium protein, unknown function [Plasmodium reichenowi]